MRIIHAVRSDGFSGVERHVATLATAQSRAGHDVSVIGGDVVMMGAALAGVPVESFPGRTVAEVMSQVRRHRGTDIVHAHMTAGELAASLASRRPLVVTRHFARRRGTTPVGRLSGALIRRRTSAQIAISRYVADAVDGAATVIYPGVEPVEDTQARRRPVVLVMQRLEAEKRTEVALRAFAQGAPQDWTLEVAGRGSQLFVLQELATTLGIAERTRFLGFRDDVPALMRSASLLVSPCEVEGLGLSVLEAMAYGLPVLASRAGAHPETVGLATDAQLFEPGDVEQAGEMLARLSADEQLRDAYGEQLAAVQRATFAPKEQVRQTDAVYRRVLT